LRLFILLLGIGKWLARANVEDLLLIIVIYRNAMRVNFAEELKPELEDSGLMVQATYKSEKDIEETYLNGAYGNAYDFDQEDRLDVAFE
jgi:hypothetical protein